MFISFAAMQGISCMAEWFLSELAGVIRQELGRQCLVFNAGFLKFRSVLLHMLQGERAHGDILRLGGCVLAGDLSRVALLAQQGVRCITLTWNGENELGSGHDTPRGLTDFGREAVREMERQGILVDVSHLNDAGFDDVLAAASRPFLASHSNSRAVCGVSRNLTDEQFKAICASGGVAGINLYTEFLGNDPVTVETICDHIIHWMDLGGAKHIALGGDLDGCETLPVGFTGVNDWPAVAATLANRGLSAAEIEDIFWNNAMRMWGKCCM